MAATEAYSSLYSTTNVGTALYNRPLKPPSGATTDAVAVTIPTTQMDDVGDFYHFIPVPVGATLTALWFNVPVALAASLLNADWVLRTKDKAGNITDTVLWAGGTGFTAAITTDRLVTLASVVVPNAATSFGSIGFKVNVAAGTPAAGVVNLGALWR